MVPADTVRIEGTPQTYQSSEHGRRLFCGHCGDRPVLRQREVLPGMIDIQSGTLSTARAPAAAGARSRPPSASPGWQPRTSCPNSSASRGESGGNPRGGPQDVPRLSSRLLHRDASSRIRGVLGASVIFVAATSCCELADPRHPHDGRRHLAACPAARRWRSAAGVWPSRSATSTTRCGDAEIHLAAIEALGPLAVRPLRALSCCPPRSRPCTRPPGCRAPAATRASAPRRSPRNRGSSPALPRGR